jgi:hypothetical protein
MHRSHHARRERGLNELAAPRRDSETSAQERLRGGRAKAHDDLRTHDLQFCVEPRPARRDFCRIRLRVDTTLPARFPFEMLDDVRDVGPAAIDARFLERLRKNAAGRTDTQGPVRRSQSH